MTATTKPTEATPDKLTAQAVASDFSENGTENQITAFDWTDAAVAALPLRATTYELEDPLTPGLVLRVASTGRKSFSFTYPTDNPELFSCSVSFDLVHLEVARSYTKKKFVELISMNKSNKESSNGSTN